MTLKGLRTADICCMILCATYANLQSGGEGLQALGEGKRPGGNVRGEYVQGKCLVPQSTLGQVAEVFIVAICKDNNLFVCRYTVLQIGLISVCLFLHWLPSSMLARTCGV